MPQAGLSAAAGGDARPASTLLLVDELIWPAMLIEIEVVAAGGNRE